MIHLLKQCPIGAMNNYFVCCYNSHNTLMNCIFALINTIKFSQNYVVLRNGNNAVKLSYDIMLCIEYDLRNCNNYYARNVSLSRSKDIIAIMLRRKMLQIHTY